MEWYTRQKLTGGYTWSSDNATTPFATVTYFEHDFSINHESADELLRVLHGYEHPFTLAEHDLRGTDAWHISLHEGAGDTCATEALSHAHRCGKEPVGLYIH